MLTRAAYHAHTLFLFTKDDFRTTMIPITIFAAASGPLYSAVKLLHVLFWIWLHLLHFNLSNQTRDVSEDLLNKPNRPLPSGRISLSNAVALRWLSVPLCWALSAAYSPAVLMASMTLTFFVIVYNELGASGGHFFVRNLLNAIGLGCFEVGATLIAAKDPSHLDSTVTLSVLLSTSILTTTYHAQDFRDIHGDRLIGRKTLPIVYPSIARPSVAFGVPWWTVVLCLVWELCPIENSGAMDVTSVIVAGLLVGVAGVVGGRFVLLRDVKDDRISFHWYNAWLTIVHLLPGVWRWSESRGRVAS